MDEDMRRSIIDMARRLDEEVADLAAWLDAHDPGHPRWSDHVRKYQQASKASEKADRLAR